LMDCAAPPRTKKGSCKSFFHRLDGHMKPSSRAIRNPLL
jgi:hypothetical protein